MGEKQTSGPTISAVIPFYNEEENAGFVLLELAAVLEIFGKPWEMIAVDDGSTDGTLSRLLETRDAVPGLRVLKMRRNVGQTGAMQAGFDAVRGRLVITLDGDGQNDPSAVPALLSKLDEGFDLVCGWRQRRQDRWLSRKLPSLIANKLISVVTGVWIHDNGCSLKAYQSALIQRLNLYAEQHRFIPALAALHGARIAEVKVPHRARRAGQSKYGLSRTYKVLIDLVTIRLLRRLRVAPSIPFLLSGALLSAVGLAGVAKALLTQLDGQPIVVWAGVSVLFLYLAGYLLLLAFLAELLSARPRSPGTRSAFHSEELRG